MSEEQDFKEFETRTHEPELSDEDFKGIWQIRVALDGAYIDVVGDGSNFLAYDEGVLVFGERSKLGFSAKVRAFRVDEAESIDDPKMKPGELIALTVFDEREFEHSLGFFPSYSHLIQIAEALSQLCCHKPLRDVPPEEPQPTVVIHIATLERLSEAVRIRSSKRQVAQEFYPTPFER